MNLLTSAEVCAYLEIKPSTAGDISLPLQKAKPANNSFVKDLASASNELSW